MPTHVLYRLCSHADALDAHFAAFAYERAFVTKDIDTLIVLAARQDLPEAVDAQLAHHPLARVRAAWLARPGHSPAVLHNMLEHETRITVFEALAGNPDASVELLERLAALQNTTVALQLLMNPTCTMDILAACVGPAVQRPRLASKHARAIKAAIETNPANADEVLGALCEVPEQLISFQHSVLVVIGFASPSVQVAVVDILAASIYRIAIRLTSRTFNVTNNWNALLAAGLSPDGIAALSQWHHRILEDSDSSLPWNAPVPPHPLFTTSTSSNLADLVGLLSNIEQNTLPPGVDSQALARSLARNKALDAVGFARSLRMVAPVTASWVREPLLLTRIDDYDSMLHALARNPELLGSRTGLRARNQWPGLYADVVTSIVNLRDVDADGYHAGARVVVRDPSLDDAAILALPWDALVSPWGLASHTASAITRLVGTTLVTPASLAVFESLQGQFTGTFAELLAVAAAA